MKLRHGIAIGCLSVLLGIGAFAGVAENAPVKKVEASTGYYMVGSGSFVSGSDWSTEGGIELNNSADDNNIGELTNLYLEEGDILKFSNGSGGWYGHDKYQSGGDTLTSTLLNSSSEPQIIRCSVVVQFDWWYEASCHTRISITCVDSSHNDVIDLDDSSKNVLKEFDVYSDVTSIEFKRQGNYVGNEASIDVNESIWSKAKEFYIYDDWGTAKVSSGDYGDEGTNIYVNYNGYYNFYLQKTSFYVYATWQSDFKPGYSIYLNTNGNSNWNGKTPIVHIWNSSHTGEAKDREMTPVGGRSGLFEYVVQSEYPSANPNYVIFYHNLWEDKTADLLYTKGSNTFTLNSDSSSGSWNGFLTYEQRAVMYGDYFKAQTSSTCSSKTAPSDETWTGLSIDYSHMNDLAKNVVKTADATKYDDEDPSAYTSYEEAMNRYDQIVSWRGMSNFMYRDIQITSSGAAFTNPAIFSSNQSTTFAAVSLTFVATLSATSGFFLLKKKKEL